MFDLHPIRSLDIDWGIIEDGSDSNLDKVIDHVLGSFGWHCQHGDLDIVVGNVITHCSKVFNNQVADLLADLFGVDVKHSRDSKSPFGKAPITRKAAAQITGTNHDHIPDILDIQNVIKLIGQEIDLVAFPPLSKFAKMG